MQTQFNLRDRPLADEMRPHFLSNHELDKRHMQKVLLEWRLEEFRRERDEAARRAMCFDEVVN